MMNAPARPTHSDVLVQVLVLLGDTLLAQVIAFIAQISITRLYTDTNLDYLEIFTSTAILGVAVADARFGLNTVLPAPGDEASARSLVGLASCCMLVASALTTLITIAAWPWMSAHYGSVLAGWVLAVGVSILFLAQRQVCSYWLACHRQFQAIASSSMVHALGIVVLQLVYGFVAGRGLGVAIGATIAGQGIAVAYLSWRARDARERQDTDPTLREVASRYRKMAFVGVPNIVVDALRTSIIPMLIATYSVTVLGQFSLAWPTLQAPVALIAGALSQVYLPYLSDTPPSEMARVALRVGGVALACSIPMFTPLAWVSPVIFPFVFGARWEATGYFVRSLAPWLTLTIATSPLSNVFIATCHQRRMLAFACVYCAAPLAWLAYSPYGVEATVTMLRAPMVALLVRMLLMAIVTACAYDRGDVARPVTA